MAATDRTRALMQALADTLGIETIPASVDGGARLTAGHGTGDVSEVLIYGGDEETILLVAPVGPLPRGLTHATMLYLFRSNLFSSSCAPFQIAADEFGTLVLWGRLWIADLDGASLAGLVDAVAGKVGELRQALQERATDGPGRIEPGRIEPGGIEPGRAGRGVSGRTGAAGLLPLRPMAPVRPG